MKPVAVEAFLPALLEVESVPPHPLARATTASVVLLLAVAVAWASVGRVDEVSVAPGKLVPRGEVKPVQVAEQGVVRAVGVAEGDRVEAGQTLLELDPTDAEADRDRLGHEVRLARGERARMEVLWDAVRRDVPEGGLRWDGGEADWLERERLTGEWEAHRAEARTHAEAVRRARAELSALAERVKGLEGSVPLLARRADAARRLAENKLAAEHAYLEIEQGRIEAEGELRAQRARLAELEASVRLAEERRGALEAAFRRDVLARLQEAERRVAGLEEERRKAEHRLSQRSVRAPAAGLVQQLAVPGAGTVVTPSSPVMVVVPEGVELEVEGRLANRDVGFVREGQEAVVKLEAFPFTRYGTLHGRVVRVSADSVGDERQGLAYALRVALDDQYLEAGDGRVRLSPGMAAAIEVRTGERRLISFFLEPLLRYRDESLRER